jgi:PEP-CTERM motif
MKKLLLAASALVMGLPSAANAAVDVTVNFGATNPIPANNDFQALLAGLGLTKFATTGASLILNSAAVITFEFLGTESGFSDTFMTSNINFTENTSFQNNFAAPINMGATAFTAGSLAGLLNFTSAGGIPATVNQDGFGIFLGPNQVSGQNFTTFYFGYDDQINNQDDNHDDFIVKATVSGPVPEPATWAMFVSGFGLIGWSIRRRRRATPAGAALAHG